MQTQRLTCGVLVMALIGLVCWGTLGVAAAQTTLIYACVDTQGRLRVIAAGGSCGQRETLLTWPAEPGGVTYYQRETTATVGVQPFILVALCDSPEDVAISGGPRLERDPGSSEFQSCDVPEHVSCQMSGRCSGAAGQDGWLVTLTRCSSGPAPLILHVYVTCSQP
jgi:hypothetical protein